MKTCTKKGVLKGTTNASNQKIVASSINTTSRNASQRYVLSPNRCTNVFLVGKENFKDVCSKRMLIDTETNEEFCPQCRSVEKKIRN